MIYCLKIKRMVIIYFLYARRNVDKQKIKPPRNCEAISLKNNLTYDTSSAFIIKRFLVV